MCASRQPPRDESADKEVDERSGQHILVALSVIGLLRGMDWTGQLWRPSWAVPLGRSSLLWRPSWSAPDSCGGLPGQFLVSLGSLWAAPGSCGGLPGQPGRPRAVSRQFLAILRRLLAAVATFLGSSWAAWTAPEQSPGSSWAVPRWLLAAVAAFRGSSWRSWHAPGALPALLARSWRSLALLARSWRSWPRRPRQPGRPFPVVRCGRSAAHGRW